MGRGFGTANRQLNSTRIRHDVVARSGPRLTLRVPMERSGALAKVRISIPSAVNERS
jgi:hypothetical protein